MFICAKWFSLLHSLRHTECPYPPPHGDTSFRTPVFLLSTLVHKKHHHPCSGLRVLLLPVLWGSLCLCKINFAPNLCPNPVYPLLPTHGCLWGRLLGLHSCPPSSLMCFSFSVSSVDLVSLPIILDGLLGVTCSRVIINSTCQLMLFKGGDRALSARHLLPSHSSQTWEIQQSTT